MITHTWVIFVLSLPSENPCISSYLFHIDYYNNIILHPTVKKRFKFCSVKPKDANCSPQLVHRTVLNYIRICFMNLWSETDFSCGDYGMGLYFSQHPSTAAHFSAVSCRVSFSFRLQDQMNVHASVFPCTCDGISECYFNSTNKFWCICIMHSQKNL